MNIEIYRLTRWIQDEDLADYDGPYIDKDMRVWMPVFDNYDAIRGARVVGQVPAAQAYHWRLTSFIARQKWEAMQPPPDTTEEPF